MTDKIIQTIHSSIEHGTVASHTSRDAQPFIVAPTTANHTNTLELDLVAIACISLHDTVFEFDSSFPTPDIALMLNDVHPMRQRHKSATGQLPLISIFGHADPVGDDAYNKTLSGRRARAVYGLLTHDLAIWDQLFQEEWVNKKETMQTARSATGLPTTTARAKLLEAYMTQLFPQKLVKADFLGRGADSKGRADFQGCSEFNPLVILSKDENTKLTADERNAQNRGNRRVLIFFFRPGLKVNASLWPCPAATDPSVAACKKRFFGPPKSGDERRKPGDERRAFTSAADTFACRFYSRISESSPCENPVPVTRIIIRLFNVLHEPMAGLKYKLEVGGKTFSAKTNKEGILAHDVPVGVTTGKLTLDMWTVDLYITPIGPPDHPTGLQTRLQNLGFFDEEAGERAALAEDDTLAHLALMRFQSANKLPSDGQMNDDTKQKLRDVYGS